MEYQTQFFSRLGPALENFCNQTISFIGDYIFGIVALILWLRVVVTILNGRTSVLLIVLAVIFSGLAFTQGQLLW